MKVKQAAFLCFSLSLFFLAQRNWRKKLLLNVGETDYFGGPRYSR